MTTKRFGLHRLLLLWILMLMHSCKVNTVYENREQDKNEAQKITDSFYTLIKKGNYDQSKNLFMKEFFKVTSSAKLDSFYHQIDNMCGQIIEDSLSGWKTSVIEGSRARSEYVLQYNVARTKQNTVEILTLKKDNSGVKIISYKVNFN